MMLDMLEYYNMLEKLNINIIYIGSICPDGIESIAGTLKRRLEFDDLPLSASQSVFSVFVEQMNNILMYSAEKDHFNDKEGKYLEKSKGIFLLGVQNKTYFIQSGNVINDSSIEPIKSRIDHLNSLDKKELRQYYKEQIKAENTNPESKGAGIGFIEIARRASAPIEYSFVPFGEGLSFFTMFVTIG